MHQSKRRSTRPEQAGLVIHGAARYDFIVWLFTLGRERRLREKMLRLAALRSGEHILDIGCGTGTLAIMAKRRVGGRGAVHGIDASPEMVEHARMKAKRAGVDITFTAAPAQALPLPDQSIDIVTSTLMLHHLPRKARPHIVREIKRVLKPGGRFLAIDFIKPSSGRQSFMDRFHRHGFVRLDEVVAELESEGFTVAESGAVGERDLQFVEAVNGPAALRAGASRQVDVDEEGAAHVHGAGRHRGGGLLLVALAVLGVVALIALHGGAALSIRDLGSGPLGYFAIGALVLVILAKLGFLAIAHGLGAKMITRWLGAREE
jgi:ubiquinone/menaquinone biosynthesis C-methylase UbiE